MPSVLASLGFELDADRRPVFALPPARRSVVVLLDGLGERLLRRRSGHAPFLRTLLQDGPEVVSGFPSTTATSLASLGTGRPPGEHGLLGYQSLIPGTGVVFDHLSWENGPDPLTWQPDPTLFERATAAGLAVARIGLPHFDGSGLTVAALRGGDFLPARSLAVSVEAALGYLQRHSRCLIYLYWGEIDRTGHERGCRSLEWGLALERADAALRELAQRLPDDTSLHITADHGMVDIPFEARIDLATDPELDAGLAHLAGEPRAPHLYTVPGAADDVAATWAARFGDRALVRRREAAIAEGWFGSTAARNVDRIGDVVVAFADGLLVQDSRTSKPILLQLLGMHGSVTPDEVAVPLLTVPGRKVC